MKQLTPEQAVAFSTTGAWKRMTARERAVFQIDQDRLCMPWECFHAAVEESLGRPVWTHEFALNKKGLREELVGNAPTPTLADILALLPAEKTVVVCGAYRG